MSDLRRFPVSDEFISYRQTLDSVCDRMDFFEYACIQNDWPRTPLCPSTQVAPPRRHTAQRRPACETCNVTQTW